MNVLDLFSGIGGFSLGLERAGMRTVAFCEIEPFCRKVLARHWPNVKQYTDVRTLTADQLMADGIPRIDVICGGFPCQDISVAGKGAGLAGERSGLWREYARIIGEVRPKFVIVENVAALLGRGLGDVLGDLAALGYDAEWHCIPASYVGAPHRRDRLWIISYASEHRCGERQIQYLNRRNTKTNFSVDGEAQYLSYSAQLQCNGGNDNSAISMERGAFPESGNSSRAANVAHATSIGQQGQRESIQWGDKAPDGERQANITESMRIRSQWSIEPDVGRRLDGFPSWLVRHCGKGLSYAESKRSIQALREVWCADVSQALWENIGGFERIQQAEILFAVMRELEKKGFKTRESLEGAEVRETVLRVLRRTPEFTCASLRSESVKQRTGELADTLQVVPQLPSCDSEKAWAIDSWEDGIARVANGIPSRVDRLKGLGNAVVPQIPELIGKAILNAERNAA